MTEENVTYVTDYASNGNIIMNNEELSKKQLYSIITSKNLFIDKLLIEIDRLNNELKTSNKTNIL